MVYARAIAAASGSDLNLFGAGSVAAIEAFAQFSATEAATITGLAARIASGGSGNNVLRFRKAGANGNNVVPISGTGTFTDTTHNDVLAAGDLFNLQATDDGSDPVYQWALALVEFAAGHGNFHACSNFSGVTLGVAAATRFIRVSGNQNALATEADAEIKVYGYDSLEAFQVRMSANTAAADCTVTARVNGASVGTPLVIGAGLTGLFSLTGMGIALASGDRFCLMVVRPAGAGTPSASFVGATLKSTSGASELSAGSSGNVRAASATPAFYPIGGQIVSATGAVEADNVTKLGFPARVGKLGLYLTPNTYTADCQFTFRVDGVDRLLVTVTAGVAGWHENLIDTFDLAGTENVCWSLVGGGTGSGTLLGMRSTLVPVPTLPAATIPGGDGWYPHKRPERRIKRAKPERSLRQMFEPMPLLRPAETPMPEPRPEPAAAQSAADQANVSLEIIASDPRPLLEGLASLRSLAEARAIAQATEEDDAEILVVM